MVVAFVSNRIEGECPHVSSFVVDHTVSPSGRVFRSILVGARQNMLHTVVRGGSERRALHLKMHLLHPGQHVAHLMVIRVLE